MFLKLFFILIFFNIGRYAPLPRIWKIKSNFNFKFLLSLLHSQSQTPKSTGATFQTQFHHHSQSIVL